jgi:hypothetical protein
MHVVFGTNLGEVKNYLSHAASILLSYLLQKITKSTFYIFQKSINTCRCMALRRVALVLIRRHKSLCRPSYYCHLYEVESHDFKAGSNGIILIQNFTQIHRVVFEINAERQMDRRTDTVNLICVNFRHIVQKPHNLVSNNVKYYWGGIKSGCWPVHVHASFELYFLVYLTEQLCVCTARSVRNYIDT